MLLILRVGGGRQGGGTCQHRLRVEAGIGGAQQNKASDKQARTSQQHERERDFRDDQQVAQAVSGSPFGSAAPAFLESFIDVDFRGVQRGSQTENQAR